MKKQKHVGFLVTPSLKQAMLKRAKRRTHRPCSTHGPVRELCASCLKIICPKCKPPHACVPIEHQPWATSKKPFVVQRRRATDRLVVDYKPTKEMDPVWEVIQPLGALSIDPHPDSGHWQMTFPVRVLGLVQASDLATRLWTDARLRLVANPTPYGSGAIPKPMTWYVTFSLKKG